MKTLLVPLALLALAPAGGPPAAAPAAPATRAERLMWNARERTASGARALAAGDAESAVAAFDTARRLRADDPRTDYNAGTARMGRDDAGAAQLLEGAARAAGPALAPDAWYNLGTARLAAGDAGGAVEALREALRRAPARVDAKQNLELALAEVARQQAQPPQSTKDGEPRPQPGGGDDQEREREERAGSPGEGEPRDADGERPPSPQPGEAGAEAGSGEPGAANRQQPLPQFRDLPDMTAEQAAAILRAVEDLERQQRRERAERAAAQRATVELDW